MFVSAGFLNENLKAPKATTQVIQSVDETKQEEILECQHCRKVGHMENHCFNF